MATATQEKPVGRNDPCPCGSGRRYKQCHGAVGAASLADVDPTSPDALIAHALRAHQRGDYDAAERGYRAALALTPLHQHALHYLGVVLYQRNRLSEALPLLEQSVALLPDDTDFHNNHGLALFAADRNDDAIAAYRRSIARKPDYAGAWNNLGLALQAANDLTGAIDAYRTALRYAPDFPEAHWNFSLALLAHGEFADGWREYEWRVGLAPLGGGSRLYAGPRWRGADPAGKTILLTQEQGLGDTLQFARFAATLAERGARVVMEVPDPLVRLMAAVPGVAEVCAAMGALPRYDAHLPLLSVAAALGVEARSIPHVVPYVVPDAREVAAIGPLLDRYPGTLKVGLSWAGRPDHSNDRRRSCPLAALTPLLALTGITWFSLQKDDGEDQIAQVPAANKLVLLDARNDFERKAALVSALDLVVSVDTSIAHLAGALARPVWILLPFAPDWRWQLGRDDSPWYPTARLFRQPRAGDWDTMIAGVREALLARIAAAA